MMFTMTMNSYIFLNDHVITFSGIDVVGLLVKDVVDSVDQEVEGEGHPDQDWEDCPVPDIAREPHAHDGGPNGVYPQYGPRDLN